MADNRQDAAPDGQGRRVARPRPSRSCGWGLNECLNEHWFPTLRHAHTSIESWWRDSNGERPKQSLGGLRHDPVRRAVGGEEGITSAPDAKRPRYSSWGYVATIPNGFNRFLLGGLLTGAFGSTQESRAKSDPAVLKPVNPGRNCEGECKPCPPGVRWYVNRPGHGHANGYWHTINYNQDPMSCMCYPDRPSGGLQGN